MGVFHLSIYGVPSPDVTPVLNTLLSLLGGNRILLWYSQQSTSCGCSDGGGQDRCRCQAIQSCTDGCQGDSQGYERDRSMDGPRLTGGCEPDGLHSHA